MTATLLEVNNLKKYFPIKKGIFSKVVGNVHAVEKVTFSIKESQTLGLVGESGCGKTTVGRTLLRLLEPTYGEVSFNGDNILSYNAHMMRELRKKMQIIFQDPYSSLNPRMTVNSIVGEALKVHKIGSRKERKGIIENLLQEVGLTKRYINRYPHEFSGGQRQRIGIARALALNPSFIVCDEPVSALDVSIQAQILNLLRKLQDSRGISYLFIAHNLHVVEHISHNVAVMYLGEIVEMGAKNKGNHELYDSPLHPYTRALLAANPSPDPEAPKNKVVLTGNVPTPINPPLGCKFHTRCPYAQNDSELLEMCKSVNPPIRRASDTHYVRCLMYGGEDGMEGKIEPKENFLQKMQK
ncbi:MAG: ATP-binding cassette domain-containing protein [Planctomycetes bacterium]|nr:ATP-binding cassette domain-containing protein [Planctomycetota bacterium]